MIDIEIPLVENLHQEEIVQNLEALWFMSVQFMQNEESFCKISFDCEQDSDIEQVCHGIVELVQACNKNSNSCTQIFSFL